MSLKCRIGGLRRKKRAPKHTVSVVKQLDAEHGIICRLPGERLGYFGWPSVARLDDGTLVAAGSGLRYQHVCPFGKVVLSTSNDDGRTWYSPRVIRDSMIDDRDAGIVNLGDSRLLVAWFTSDTRQYAEYISHLPKEDTETWPAIFASWTDEVMKSQLGSWVMLSDDRGATWGAPIRVPVTAPHGPILLRSGSLLYLGKRFKCWDELSAGEISTARSLDGGHIWEEIGTVPVYPGTDPCNYHEPHVLELPSGRLIGMIRVENHSGKELTESGIPSFSMMQTESDDGGCSWTIPQPLGFHGSPPHLMRHSSGLLILTYGYRQEPYGQRVAVSSDDGATWEHDWIIRDDGPDGDLGYPSMVELADGSLFAVYYQKVPGDTKCSLLWSRFRLPEELLHLQVGIENN